MRLRTVTTSILGFALIALPVQGQAADSPPQKQPQRETAKDRDEARPRKEKEQDRAPDQRELREEQKKRKVASQERRRQAAPDQPRKQPGPDRTKQAAPDRPRKQAGDRPGERRPEIRERIRKRFEQRAFERPAIGRWLRERGERPGDVLRRQRDRQPQPGLRGPGAGHEPIAPPPPRRPLADRSEIRERLQAPGTQPQIEQRLRDLQQRLNRLEEHLRSLAPAGGRPGAGSPNAPGAAPRMREGQGPRPPQPPTPPGIRGRGDRAPQGDPVAPPPPGARRRGAGGQQPESIAPPPPAGGEDLPRRPIP